MDYAFDCAGRHEDLQNYADVAVDAPLKKASSSALIRSFMVEHMP
jgi:hypothetical protein